MDLDKILVTIFSIGGIVFTYWFFLMKREKVLRVASDSVDITVSGGYQPEAISIPQGKTTTIFFTRKDSSSCLEEVVISEFKIRKYLPLNKKVSVKLNPQQKGEFRYSCGMNMYHGKIIVD